MLCVFDCETIPDTEMIKKHFPVTQDDPYLMCEEAFILQEEKTGSGFLPLPFHKVVSIAAVIADDYGNFLKVGNFPKGAINPSEEELIESFFAFIEEKQPKLVSFNGRAFDMPMLLIRAMKYNLSLPAYFETDNRDLNKNKWENYRARFSENFHNDLLETLGNYGAARGLKLDELCSCMELPGKYDVSGDEVTKLYFDEEITRIQEYCESDVLNTYWLYLKYELLKGELLKRDYYAILSHLAENMNPHRNYTEVFRAHIQKELENAQTY